MRVSIHLRAALAAVLFAACASAHAQVVDATVCDVINHPMKFDGKTVRLKGVVQADYDVFILRGDSCTSSLWLSYPAGTKAKSGPAAIVTLQLAANATAKPGPARPALTLERSKDFDTFDNLLAERTKTPGMCLACPKNDVQATLVGRVDGTDNAGLTKDGTGKITALDGFGNLNAYAARLVITSVSDVSAREIDYSKAPKVANDTFNAGNNKDLVGTARKSELAFPKGSDAIAQIEEALNAYGALGTDNGVIIGFGNVANVPDGEGAKSSKQSPDGLILNVTLDSDRLKGDAESRAIAHQGTEIAMLRQATVPGAKEIESRAWNTVIISTIGAREKTLTLPGGVVLWSDAWPAADKNANASAALTSFLEDREQIPR